MNQMTERTIRILEVIYQLRILSFEQIYNYFYKNKKDGGIGSPSYCRKDLSILVNKDKCIEKVRYNQINYYQITTIGVKRLKENGSQWIGGEDAEKFLIDDYVKASRSIIKEKAVAHQVELNEFVLAFQNKNYPVSWFYKDDKFANKEFVGVRPDGLLKIENLYYLLEMDMNTETKKQLRVKWTRYRQIINKGTNIRMEKIRVLFILSDNMNTAAREQAILDTIEDFMLEYINRESFNIYIGTKKELAEVVRNEVERTYIKDISDPFVEAIKNQGFSVDDGFGIGIDEMSIPYYIRKKTESGSIMVSNGAILEYIVEDYREREYSAIANLYNYDYINMLFKTAHNRNIKMIVLLSEEDAYQIVKKIAEYNENIYFTTTKRITEKGFPNGLFRWDIDGSKWHLGDNMKEKIYEK